MRKKLTTVLVLLLVVVCIFTLCACKKKKRECEHESTHETLVAAPTCTQAGQKKIVCDVCGATVSTEEIQPTGHSSQPDEVVVRPADCTHDGLKQFICKVCKQVVRTEEIKAIGHSTQLDEVIVNPAECLTDGLKAFVCTNCHQSLRTETIPALSHEFGAWYVSEQPTTEKAGKEIRVCANDESHVEEHTIPVLNAENYDVSMSEATCSHDGSAVYTCKTNSNWVFDVYLPQLPHTYNGAAEGYCLVCNAKYYTPGLTYELSEDGTYYIVSNKNNHVSESAISIPDHYAGLPVKQIASEAFAERAWVRSVTIPYTIERIGAGAFNGCNLETVYFNAENCADFNGRNWVFYPASNSQQNIDVVIGNTVRRIPARMFFPLSTDTSKVPVVNSVTFQDHSVCQSIGDYAFYKTGITSVSIPASVKTIGNFAFYGTQLQSLVVGDGVESLGASAFASCANLTSVTFGKGLKTIGNDCFNYCTKLVEADLSDTKLQTICYDAFKGCTALNKVVLPNSVKTLEKEAFANCTALTQLTLGSGLQKIGAKAFYNCTELIQITIPQKVVEIGNGAFENCQKLVKITFLAENCNDLAQGNRVFANVALQATLEIVFGAGVQRIPARLLYGSAEIASLPHVSNVQIASSVTEVGAYAFFGVQVDSVTLQAALSQLEVLTGNDTLLSAMRR